MSIINHNENDNSFIKYKMSDYHKRIYHSF